MKNFFKYKIRVKITSSNKHHLINRENKTYSCTLLFYSKSFSSYFLSFLSSKSALLLSSINSLSVTSVFFTTSHASKLRLIIAHVKAAAWIINRILYSRMFRIKLWRFHKELLTFNFYFLFFLHRCKTKRNKMIIHSRKLLPDVEVNKKLFGLIR